MATLPTVGGDIGAWGSELNTWLVVSKNADGTLKIGGGGPGTTSGKILLAPGQSGGVQVGGVVSDNNFWWDGGSGGATTTTLYIGANTGVATEIVLNNGATAEWYIYNSPPSALANSLRISNAANDVLVLTQNPAQLALPTYGAGILGTNSTGGVSANGAWTQTSYSFPTASGLTPNIPGGTLTGGSATFRYQLIGKTVWWHLDSQLTFSGTATGPFFYSLPAAIATPVSAWQQGSGSNPSTGTLGMAFVQGSGAPHPGNVVIASSAYAAPAVSGNFITAQGTYEIA